MCYNVKRSEKRKDSDMLEYKEKTAYYDVNLSSLTVAEMLAIGLIDAADAMEEEATDAMAVVTSLARNWVLKCEDDSVILKNDNKKMVVSLCEGNSRKPIKAEYFSNGTSVYLAFWDVRQIEELSW